MPARERGYFYYSRTEKGKQYPIYARRKGSMEAPEEVLLDVNELAKGKKFMSLGDMTVSPDGHLLAYTADVTGFRAVHAGRQGPAARARLRARHRRARHVASRGRRTTRRSSTSARTRRPSAPNRLLAAHARAAAADDLVYEEKDERFDVGVSDRATASTSSSRSAATRRARSATCPPTPARRR